MSMIDYFVCGQVALVVIMTALNCLILVNLSKTVERLDENMSGLTGDVLELVSRLDNSTGEEAGVTDEFAVSDADASGKEV